MKRKRFLEEAFGPIRENQLAIGFVRWICLDQLMSMHLGLRGKLEEERSSNPSAGLWYVSVQQHSLPTYRWWRVL
jgi:hypothetical protein